MAEIGVGVFEIVNDSEAVLHVVYMDNDVKVPISKNSRGEKKNQRKEVKDMADNISGCKTIAQYKIKKWINDNFVSGCVSIEYMSDCSAMIKDKDDSVMCLSYVADEVRVVDIESL